MSIIDNSAISHFFQTYGKQVSDSPNENVYIIDRADTEFAYHLIHKNLTEEPEINNLEDMYKNLTIASIARSTFYDGSTTSASKVITSSDLVQMLEKSIEDQPIPSSHQSQKIKSFFSQIIEKLFPV